MFARQADGQ